MPEAALLASTIVSIMWAFKLRSGMKKDKADIAKSEMDMAKTKLEMELMKKKAEKE